MVSRKRAEEKVLAAAYGFAQAVRNANDTGAPGPDFDNQIRALEDACMQLPLPPPAKFKDLIDVERLDEYRPDTEKLK